MKCLLTKNAFPIRLHVVHAKYKNKVQVFKDSVHVVEHFRTSASSQPCIHPSLVARRKWDYAVPCIRIYSDKFLHTGSFSYPIFCFISRN